MRNTFALSPLSLLTLDNLQQCEGRNMGKYFVLSILPRPPYTALKSFLQIDVVNAVNFN